MHNPTCGALLKKKKKNVKRKTLGFHLYPKGYLSNVWIAAMFLALFFFFFLLRSTPSRLTVGSVHLWCSSQQQKKKKVKRKTLGFHLSKGILKQHLDSGCVFSSLFFTEKRSITSVSGFHTLCTGTHYLLTSKISGGQCFLVDPMHRSRDSQTSFFTQTFIKNWSHDIIHTFKNYFVTMFSIFSF